MGTHIASKIDYPLLESVIEVALKNGADVELRLILTQDMRESHFYSILCS